MEKEVFRIIIVQRTEGLEFKRKFWWELIFSHASLHNSTIENESEVPTCQNTNQGRIIVTDDQG